MKKKVSNAVLFTLIAIMLLMVAPVANAQQTLSSDTDANIKFRAGKININPDPDIGEVGYTKMTLNFGERLVPAKRETYHADGNSDSEDGINQGGTVLTEKDIGVLVTDSRSSQLLTGWVYKASLTSFRPTNSSNAPFDGILYLRNGTGFTNAGDNKIGTALKLENSGDYTIASDGQSVLIMTATAELGKGSHGVQWTNDNVRLSLGDGGTPTGFDVITNDIYKATLTWTLETVK